MGIEYTKKQNIILTREYSINFRGNEKTQEQVIITREDPINSAVNEETQGQDNDKRRFNKFYTKIRVKQTKRSKTEEEIIKKECRTEYITRKG